VTLPEECESTLPFFLSAQSCVYLAITYVISMGRVPWRGYQHAIDEFVARYCSEPRLVFNKTVVLRYRFHLEERGLAPGTINVRMAAVRRLAGKPWGHLARCQEDGGSMNIPRLPRMTLGDRVRDSAMILAANLSRPIPSRACLGTNNGALHRLQTAFENRSERSVGRTG
jgi:hypothetical protein